MSSYYDFTDGKMCGSSHHRCKIEIRPNKPGIVCISAENDCGKHDIFCFEEELREAVMTYFCDELKRAKEVKTND